MRRTDKHNQQKVAGFDFTFKTATFGTTTTTTTLHTNSKLCNKALVDEAIKTLKHKNLVAVSSKKARQPESNNF